MHATLILYENTKYLVITSFIHKYMYFQLTIDKRRVRKWYKKTRCFFKDFRVFIWLGPITMVTVDNTTMVTMTMLYTYHFRCVDPVLLINKSIQFIKILITTLVST